MNTSNAATGFSAMGSEARLEVLQCLVKAGGKGLRVGEIQERTGIPASTLAHHLKFLTSSSLILQEKAGRSIVCRANYPHLERLAAFILEACCSEESLENVRRPST